MTTETTPQARLRDAKLSLVQAHILDVAEQVFGAAGFVGARVRDVAARAGISLATLYAHFPNKLELYRAVHARRLGELRRAVRPAGRGADPLDRMLIAIEGYVAFHVAHPDYLRMHLQEGIAWSARDGLRTAEQARAWSRGQEDMARTFRDGTRAGLFVDDDPVSMARATNALHQVALTRWLETGMKEPAEALLPRVKAQFIRAFCAPTRVPRLLATRISDGRQGDA